MDNEELRMESAYYRLLLLATSHLLPAISHRLSPINHGFEF